jgi:hypothetical protein
MSYFYKNIDVSNILYSDSTDNTYFIGFPTTTIPVPSGQNLSLPLDLGYTINNVDVANTSTAKYTTYNTTANDVNFPTGVKAIRVICIGAGGGHGGLGGYGEVNVDLPIQSALTGGGSGGPGGNGFYSYLNTTHVSVSDKFNIVSGSPGNTGNPGNNTTNNSFNAATARGGDGQQGNSGGVSSFTLIGSSPINITADGGNGGLGGNGGYTHYNAGNVKFTQEGGTVGGSGNATSNTNSSYSPTGRDLNTNGSGNGGNGNATGGAVQIIWLYD